MSTKLYDAVVVGSGASGSMALGELVRRGLSVCVIDAGPVPGRERPARDLRAYKVQKQCHSFNRETARFFINDLDFPYEQPKTAPYLWIRNHNVGGRLNLWARACMRMTDLDFKAASHDGFGEDWPIRAKDLAPFYSQAEKLVAAKSAGRWDANAREFETRFGALGGELLPEKKAALDFLWLKKIARNRMVTWCHDTLATRVLFSGRRASGVCAIDTKTGKERVVQARLVFLCASALETTRLMLVSKAPALEGCDALGRYMMDHVSGREGYSLLGHFPTKSKGRASEPQYFHVPRFTNLQKRSTSGFRRGYTTYVYLHEQSAGFVLFHLYALGEMLPYRDSRVELSRTKADRFGNPALKITSRFQKNELAMGRHIQSIMKNVTRDFAIVRSTTGLVPPGLNCHEAGGCRMGENPKTSVVNSRNQVHGTPNLFITDSSSFVSVGSQNPSLTAMALSLRAARFAATEL